MDRFEKLAAEIIDTISQVVEKEHPEVKLKECEALISGVVYYDLEVAIAARLRESEVT